MTKKQIAIIILNYMDYVRTICCVNHLRKIGVEHDIYIVDNASPNKSFTNLIEAFFQEKNTYVVKAPKNGGYSYGNNFGITAAKSQVDYEYYCIMNPDVIVPKDFFSELCQELKTHCGYGVISPLMISYNNLDLSLISWRKRTPKEIYRQHFILNKEKKRKIKSVYPYIPDGLIEAEAVPGSCFIISADVYEKINRFDEKIFLYNEETILGIKLEREKLKCLIDIKNYYIHDHNFNIEKNTVWKHYRDDFESVKKNYKISYESRKYLCINYYEGKYLFRLKIVYILNLFLIYLKHFISLVIC